MTRVEPYGVSTREVRLSQLRDHLNDRYGVELAHWHDEDHRAALTVSRGQSISDVIVAVSCDPETPGFQIAVFTSQAWVEYGDPFVSTERDAVERAARFVQQYIPLDPTH